MLFEVVQGFPDGHRREFESLLRAIESPLINLLLSGRPRRFSRLSAEERERYLVAMSTSRLALKRKGFQAAKRLATGLYYSQPVTGATHPLWGRVHYAPPPSPAEEAAPVADIPPIRPEREVEERADVCIVGSGAGGGVLAARLAEAGQRVVVLEAGPWFARADYPRVEREAFDRLYLDRGFLPTRDAAFALLAGATVGGGTAVNWMTCLPPLAVARAEWAVEGGMTGVDGPEFDRWYERVHRRLEVSTSESDVNPSNDALRRGAIALGYREGPDWGRIPRNALGCRSRCGFCPFGCPYGARRSVRSTYLADAMRAGARLYASTSVDHVTVTGGRVRGVVAHYLGDSRSRTVTVHAPTVVLAAGAVHTPAILLRSGLRSPGIGLGLRLDPTVAIAAEFPEPVRAWEGPPQTIEVHRFRATDPGEHGPWIEAVPAHPGLMAIAVPWSGAEDHRRLMERAENVAASIVLVRDVAEGRVRVGRDERPVLDYRLSPRDRANLVCGLAEAARILRAAGATRLLSLHTPKIEVGDGHRPVSAGDLDTFLASVERAGVREQSVALFSAHPMGSARAGPDPRRAAARPSGEVHGVEGLWIGDASLLPSAPGTNPMMSILALAERTSERIRAKLRGQTVRS